MKGQAGVEVRAEYYVIGLDVFDEEGEFVRPIEERGTESIKAAD